MLARLGPRLCVWLFLAGSAAAQEPWTVRVRMGHRDPAPQAWEGRYELRHAQLVRAEVYTDAPGQEVRPDGTFHLRSHEVTAPPDYRAIVPTGLLLTVVPDEGAELVLSMEGRERAFPLAGLGRTSVAGFLKGRVQVDRPPSIELMARDQVDWDHPAVCRADDGTVWLAWVEHVPVGPRIIVSFFEAPTDFADYRPAEGGDQLFLRARVDGEWQDPTPVTGAGLVLGAPVLVPGEDGVRVIWSQQGQTGWDLMAAPATTNAGPGAPLRLTRTETVARTPVAVRASSGRVWLAWQSYREGRLGIVVGRLGEDGLEEVAVLGADQANSWSPAVAADSQGRVHVAYDTYEFGDYDVALATFQDGAEATLESRRWVARSRHFEARPAVACDARDRVWLAWEERGTEWGKDDFGALREVPGASLYRQGSLVRVAVLEGGDLLVPASPEASRSERSGTGDELRTRHSHPRLLADGAGGVWLAWRKRTFRLGQIGTMYETLVQRYAGDAWEPSWTLPESDHLTDHAPSWVAHGDRWWGAWAGDRRRRAGADEDLVVTGLRFREERVSPAAELALTPGVAPAERSHRDLRERRQVQRLREWRLEAGGRTFQVLRGDFHRHTDLSLDGGLDGCLEDAWRYALDAASLDWAGITDHDSGWWEYLWWLTQKSTEELLLPGRFVSLFGYERSTVWPLGHRNVMFAQPRIRPLPRQLRSYSDEATEFSLEDTRTLYAYLREHGGICIPHTSATRSMGLQWDLQDPLLEPVVEIYQGSRQSYEAPGAPRAISSQEDPGGGVYPEGFVSAALAKGLKHGFVAWSDHNSTHVSYSMVLVEEATREGILQALRRRHCHGATDNILVVLRVGDHLMGDEVALDAAPVLDVEVLGAGPIRSVHVLKDGAIVHTERPGTVDARFQWTDPDSQPGSAHYYYVRVEQGDEELAWSSPLWITRDP